MEILLEREHCSRCILTYYTVLRMFVAETRICNFAINVRVSYRYPIPGVTRMLIQEHALHGESTDCINIHPFIDSVYFFCYVGSWECWILSQHLWPKAGKHPGQVASTL